MREIIEKRNSSSITGRGAFRKSFRINLKGKIKNKNKNKPLTVKLDSDSMSSEVSNSSEHRVMINGLGSLREKAVELKNELNTMKRLATIELRDLPNYGKEWISHVEFALQASNAEMQKMRLKFAQETVLRRRLQHQVQDLRGTIRVYCRPRPPVFAFDAAYDTADPVLTVSSNEMVVLHRVAAQSQFSSHDDSDQAGAARKLTPLSFEFDRVFRPDEGQEDVYDEVEHLVMGSLDGYYVCVMAYGQNGAGKTHTIVGCSSSDASGGDASGGEGGIQSLAIEQIFRIAEKRSDRYQDSFTFSVLEVYDEKIYDNLLGISAISDGDLKAEAKNSLSHSDINGAVNESGVPNFDATRRSKSSKLEIRTNYDGDTVVEGLTAVSVTSAEGIQNMWKESLKLRKKRLEDENFTLYSASSHLIITINVISTNVSTGVGTVGKLQFIDLAGSDMIKINRSGRSGTSSARGGGDQDEWRHAVPSLGVLSEVVQAKCQYAQVVPYKNSTLTHLLSDTLEGAAKVLMIACVSSDAEDVHETMNTLRFASRIRQVHVGKSIKHIVSLA